MSAQGRVTGARLSQVDHTLHIEEHGTGPTVLLLHGVGQPPFSFAPLVARLQSRHRVLIPHFPGYGATPRWPRNELVNLVARLERELVARDVRELSIVGCSRGGHTGLTLALRGRVRARALALLASTAGFDEDARARYHALAHAVRSDLESLRSTWIGLMATPDFAERAPARARELMRWFDAADATAVADELELFAHAEDLRPHLSRLACSTLVCVGLADNAMPPEWSQELPVQLASCQLLAWEQTGHALLIEREREVVDAVARHLEHSA